LLIIFMIITPMDPHGLYTAVPQEHGKPASDDTPIVLQLTQAKNGAPLLSINRQEVVWAELQSRLLEIYKSRPDGVLFIKGDADVDFEYVAEAIDTAHNVNVKRVGLIP
jgi:biopolymer transport protein TolR